MLAAAGGWEGVSGEPICFVAGYYATGALVEQYGVVPVEMESVPAAVQGVSDGKCVAAAYDTGGWLCSMCMHRSAGRTSIEEQQGWGTGWPFCPCTQTANECGACTLFCCPAGQPALGLPEAAGVTPAMNAPCELLLLQ